MKFFRRRRKEKLENFFLGTRKRENDQKSVREKFLLQFFISSFGA
jgi:hypothetical protein